MHSNKLLNINQDHEFDVYVCIVWCIFFTRQLSGRISPQKNAFFAKLFLFLQLQLGNHQCMNGQPTEGEDGISHRGPANDQPTNAQVPMK